MPELPEVETVCRGLSATLTGQTITELVLTRAGMRYPFPDDLQEMAIGATIKEVRRRAKYLLFLLNNEQVLIGHLGMSGTMRLVRSDTHTPKKHDHLWWDMEDGWRMVFNDPRRFGFMLASTAAELATHPALAELGPEPLSDDFSDTYLAQALSRRSQAIKPVIMDQALVVGVGNIYASEALFRAGINPFMPANEVVKLKKKLPLLHQSIRLVLEEAIASGGSTLRDFVRSSGDSGYFQHRFLVYDRAGTPCTVCKSPIIKQQQAGRATYFCHKCQKVELF